MPLFFTLHSHPFGIKLFTMRVVCKQTHKESCYGILVCKRHAEIFKLYIFSAKELSSPFFLSEIMAFACSFHWKIAVHIKVETIFAVKSGRWKFVVACRKWFIENIEKSILQLRNSVHLLERKCEIRRKKMGNFNKLESDAVSWTDAEVAKMWNYMLIWTSHFGICTNKPNKFKRKFTIYKR